MVERGWLGAEEVMVSGCGVPGLGVDGAAGSVDPRTRNWVAGGSRGTELGEVQGPRIWGLLRPQV